MSQNFANKGSGEKRKHLVSFRTEDTLNALSELRQITENLLPHFGDHVWNRHSLVTSNVTVLSRLLYLNNLYQKIVDVPGVICEFGVHWGSTLSQLINLRSIYEPFNHSRMIYGFDTFSGFPSVDVKDGDLSKPGDLATLENYEKQLERILTLIESFPPMPHLKKFELIKGDATITAREWMDKNPHAIISLAIFDMDLYEPTSQVLQTIMPRLVRGSVLAFDEINCEHFPGETRALDEVLGLNNLRLYRSPLHPYCGWAIFGD
jgi:hypothetical protein